MSSLDQDQGSRNSLDSLIWLWNCPDMEGHVISRSKTREAGT
jgi:hypothetical protein